jgi:porin
MMQPFVLPFLARSAFIGVLVGAVSTGFYGAEYTAIAAQPQNTDALATEKSNHWTFQAIQSLSMRYHCTPNTSSTFSGKGAAISRYAMAVSLNTCLNRMGHRFANQKDLETAQALQKEFKPELTALKNRIDFLEKRAEPLESHQFSATTKLQGQAIITIQGGGFGGK